MSDQKIVKKRSVLAVFTIFLVVASIFLAPQSAQALTPFGGRVLTTIPCTCTASTLIVVGPPRPGSFLITPLSRVHRNYLPIPGRWVLGIAAAGAPCMVAVFTPLPPFVKCVPAGEGGVVIRMGTS